MTWADALPWEPFHDALHRRPRPPQSVLLPECVDDYVGEDNPVRAIDAFVDELDLFTKGLVAIDGSKFRVAVVKMASWTGF